MPLKNSIDPVKALLLILVFGVFLRVFMLGQFATWGDERLSVMEANGMKNFPFEVGECLHLGTDQGPQYTDKRIPLYH